MRELLTAMVWDDSGLAEIERRIIRALLFLAALGLIIGYGFGIGGMTGGMADFFGSR